jgi:hypothetical protein
MTFQHSKSRIVFSILEKLKHIATNLPINYLAQLASVHTNKNPPPKEARDFFVKEENRVFMLLST